MSDQLTPQDVLSKGLQRTFEGKNLERPLIFATQDATTLMSSLGSDHYEDMFIGTFDNTKTIGLDVAVTSTKVMLGRTYNGGTISVEELSKLGIDKKSVNSFLGQTIVAKPWTRLNEDVKYKNELFFYEYKVTKRHPLINAISGEETIFYNDQPVALHIVTISPIEG